MGPFRRTAHSLLLALALLSQGCYNSQQGSFETVEFKAPAAPDPIVRPLLENTERIGVLSLTNIDPLKELDIEKVVGRLADAVARGMSNIPEKSVVTQDEIRWHFKDVRFDSLSIFSEEVRTALREEMNLDALVYLELKKLETLMTPMSPSPYGGLASTPGLDLSINLEITLSNLHTGALWRHQGEQRNWQPVQLQLFSNGQTERQLLMALRTPLQQFLARVAPPPQRQLRHFERSGD
ncbi:MAG: hypothetical protein GKR89_26815 [Candidatus Latescibacteria bacterium]|nr:hypothetical protein [Candidatus Latescibacterota bacterium]